ncbi:MAG: PDZ domain-containing protein [Caldilineaceae bacterium]|nr:PDZ domain-containing protein [Caldilineaceae bacterium]
MTSPVVPPPFSYAFNLPSEPTATLLDVDNDGEADAGVQIFSVHIGANINGGSYLEQLDQVDGRVSYLVDPLTGEITQGSLLVYAPDDAQGFPNGFGEDGLLFTEDDPVVGLPQGYTVVHFGPDGFSFDRSQEAELNVLEDPASASPDFSDQGIVESFNSLIDYLTERYSFTELRGLDWEAIRAQYLPQVEEAEQIAAENPALGLGAYGAAVHRLAQDLRDAHVQSAFTIPSPAVAIAEALKNQPIATNVGVNTVELSDGRIVVSDVNPNSPAAEAGWTLGTEIVAVDGVPVAERLPTVIYNTAVGTDEGQRLRQVTNLLNFPAPEADGTANDVTIEAILPGEDAAQSFTMTPAAYPLPNRLASPTHPMPIQFRVEPTGGWLTWNGFEEPELRIAVLEEFLHQVERTPGVSGIVLDLRGNGGGWDMLYFTMASYFFNADNPVSIGWIEQDSFDVATGDFVREATPEFLISAPQPDLYYGGPIVILIDQNCASSCEFFTQFMQTNGRATVVAQYASKGAGAPINRITMPGGLLFQYTKGRAYFAGTDELNLEGKGVVPDERVPVTLESVEATLAGGDPVLEAGLAILSHLAGQALIDSLNLAPLPDDVAAGFSAIYPSAWNDTSAGSTVSYTTPDNQYLIAYTMLEPQDVAAMLARVGISDLKEALVETRSANELDWSIYRVVDANNFVNTYAVAETDDALYVIQVAAPAATADVLIEGLLYPAIDAFILSASN